MVCQAGCYCRCHLKWSVSSPKLYHAKSSAPAVFRFASFTATKLLIYTDQLQVNKECAKKAIKLKCCRTHKLARRIAYITTLAVAT